jgi:hypothetical protein
MAKPLGLCERCGEQTIHPHPARFADKTEKLCCNCYDAAVLEILLHFHNVAAWIEGRRAEP